jgi:hypothetical protein
MNCFAIDPDQVDGSAWQSDANRFAAKCVWLCCSQPERTNTMRRVFRAKAKWMCDLKTVLLILILFLSAPTNADTVFCFEPSGNLDDQRAAVWVTPPSLADPAHYCVAQSGATLAGSKLRWTHFARLKPS